jgi:hypothetical protein
MDEIFLGPMDFDEEHINKSNVTSELWRLCHQHLSFLSSEPSNFVENAIIIYCIIAPIPQEGIIFSNIIMFHVEDET